MSWTGRLLGSVKYPVSAWMTAASAIPMTTATIASTCGLRASGASGEWASSPDGCGVARVVLGDALLDLADQVGADVGGLGEDAAADPHEHREQRGAEAEALQYRRRVALVEQHHDGRAEEAQPDGHEADHAARAEGDLHRAFAAALAGVRGGGDAQVRPGGQRHAGTTDERAEQRADHEEHRTADRDACAALVDGEQEEQYDRDDHKHAEGLELADQVRARTFLHGPGDLLHFLDALTVPEFGP